MLPVLNGVFTMVLAGVLAIVVVTVPVPISAVVIAVVKAIAAIPIVVLVVAVWMVVVNCIVQKRTEQQRGANMIAMVPPGMIIFCTIIAAV
ncbi:MAG: hypothetical protein ACI9GW_003302 [Halieaceae bacterium]|jgi:hypothetical protein